MSKIDNLKATATAFDVPVTKLIDFVTGYTDEPTQMQKSQEQILLERIVTAKKLDLHSEYINGLNDAYKLLFSHNPNQYLSKTEGEETL